MSANAAELIKNKVFNPDNASLYLGGETMPTLLYDMEKPGPGYVRFDAAFGVLSAIRFVAAQIDQPMPQLLKCTASDGKWQQCLSELASYYSVNGDSAASGLTAMDAYMLIYCESLEGGPARWKEGMLKGSLATRDGGTILYATTPKKADTLRHTEKRDGRFWQRPPFLAGLVKELGALRDVLVASNASLADNEDGTGPNPLLHPWAVTQRVCQVVVHGALMFFISELAQFLEDHDYVDKIEKISTVTGDPKTVSNTCIRINGAGLWWKPSAACPAISEVLQEFNELLRSENIDFSFVQGPLPTLRIATSRPKGAMAALLGLKRPAPDLST